MKKTKKNDVTIRSSPNFAVNDDGVIIELFKINRYFLDIQMSVSAASLFGYNKEASFHVVHTVEFPTAVIVDVFGNKGVVPEERMNIVRKIQQLDEEIKND
jgi:hypothetical protein